MTQLLRLQRVLFQCGNIIRAPTAWYNTDAVALGDTRGCTLRSFVYKLSTWLKASTQRQFPTRKRGETRSRQVHTMPKLNTEFVLNTDTRETTRLGKAYENEKYVAVGSDIILNCKNLSKKFSQLVHLIGSASASDDRYRLLTLDRSFKFSFGPPTDRP